MMTERDLALVITASVGFDMIDFSNPVAHLTGVRPLGPSLLVVTQDEIWLVTTPAADAERIGGHELAFSWLATDDLLVKLKEIVSAASLRRYRVGYIGLGAMPWGLAARVHEIAGSGEDLTRAFAAATGAKTAIEIDNARKATAIAEAGYRRLLESVTPGMRECDVAVDLNLFMRELGANDCFLMMHCASRSEAVMPPTERKIERGDLILVELSPAVDGQFTQICRTVCVGNAGPSLSDNYKLLVDAMLEGVAAVRPGAAMSEVCSAINRVVESAGYGDYAHPPFIRRRGHGLGSASTWPGDVALDNETVLERDMLFMVHPNQFLPESGYLMCGEPVVVAQDSGEVLSRQISALGIVGT
jgi:Xaa-Pro aminopeptidase